MKRHWAVYLALLVVSVLLLLIRVLPLSRDRKPVLLSEQDLVPYRDGESYAVPGLILDRGIYTVQVESHGLEVMRISIDGYSDDSWYRISSIISETTIDLAFGQQDASRRIVVREQGAPCRLRLLKSESGDGILQLPLAVSLIYRPMQSVFCFTFYTLVPFLFLFCVLFLFFHFADRNDRAGEWMLIGYALLLLILSIPVLRSNVPLGDDSDVVFHLSRIASMAQELARGQIPVRIGSAWFRGYGTPVNVFYGELFLLLPSLLHMGGLPAWQCYNIAAILNNLMLLVFSHLCFRELSGKRSYAFCLTLIYATNYRYFYNIYDGAAFGEATGMAFFPLVILGFYRLFTASGEQARRCILPLVAGFSGLIQSHVISLFQAVLFSVVFCTVRFRHLLSGNRLRILLYAAGYTGLLNLWFLLPFLDYYFRHDIRAQSVTSIIRDSAAEPVWLLTGQDEGSIGLSLTCLLLLGVYLTYKTKASGKRDGLILLGVLSVFALFLSTTFMPWHWLETNLAPLYGLLGGKIEFAIRYLSPATSLICAFGALAVRDAELSLPDMKQALRFVLYGLTVWSFLQISMLAGNFNSYDPVFRSDMVDPDISAASEPSYVFADLDWAGFLVRERTDEVLMKHGNDSVVIADTTRDGLTFVCPVENTTDDAVDIDFPVFHYHGMIAEDETGRLPVTDNEERCVRVTVPSGYEGTLTVRFAEPWYWRVAELVSVASLLAGIFLYRRRLRFATTSSR